MRTSFYLLASMLFIASCSNAISIRELTVSTFDSPWQEQSECTAATGAPKDTILIDTACTAREINGFGVSFSELGWQSLSRLSEEDRTAVLDELFLPGKGGNLTINRMPVGANDFSIDWYSYNENDGDFTMEKFSIDHDMQTLVPLIREALKRNPEMKIWASPWCPPSWMKYNHHYAMRPDVVNDLTEAGRGHEGKDMFIQEERYFDAYALYFKKFIEAYRNAGIDIFMVMPQNEPNSDQNFPSCCWTSAGLCRFLAKLCPAMDELGVKTYFGTCERPNTALIDTVLTDTEVGKYISGVAFQWAGRSALPYVRDTYPDKDLVMSEQECGDGKNNWSGALHSWDLMKHYLGNGVSIYDYWNISLFENGLSRWAWRQNSLIVVDRESGEYRFTIEYYLLKHVSHFVQKGARNIRLQDNDDALAFLNPDGSVILVACNRDEEAKDIAVNVNGKTLLASLQPESFSTFCISSGND